MSISLKNINYDTSAKNTFSARGRYGEIVYENNNNEWGLGKAAGFTVVGAGMGAAHVKFFNRKAGKLPKLAENPTVKRLKAAIAEKAEKKALTRGQKRTAKKALNILENAPKNAQKKSMESASKLLREGTKPYGTASIVGAAIGFAIFLFHKAIDRKNENNFMANQQIHDVIA